MADCGLPWHVVQPLRQVLAGCQLWRKQLDVDRGLAVAVDCTRTVLPMGGGADAASGLQSSSRYTAVHQHGPRQVGCSCRPQPAYSPDNSLSNGSALLLCFCLPAGYEGTFVCEPDRAKALQMYKEYKAGKKL